MQRQDRWCFAWFASRPTARGAERAALVKGSKWTSGDTITASFLDGATVVQDRVREVAERWTAPGLANLTLDFRDDPDTMIRISFKYRGSWSVIGTSCKQAKDGEPTMNYGWLRPESTDDDLRRVVLHEFGHALGLIHEHQNPVGGIKWNREAVIASLSGPPNNWSLEVIERNMFEPYQKQEVNATELDPKSIMMYPIPASWTLDGFTADLNADLSAKDKIFVHGEYA